MKNLTFLFVIALAAFVIGCNGGSESTNNNNNNNTTPSTETPASSETITPPPMETTTSIEQVPAESVPPAAGAPSGDVKLNPPHGEPGHRCDIAVGAPLPL